MNYAIDIYVDWTTQDDTGLPWSLVSEAADPSRIVPGAFVIAGHDDAIAVVEVMDRDEEGVVHLRMLPGPISASAHLLHAPAS